MGEQGSLEQETRFNMVLTKTFSPNAQRSINGALMTILIKTKNYFLNFK